jgi:hypothetical protein
VIGNERAKKIIDIAWKLDEAKKVDELMQALHIPEK